eukprot:2259986-Amphidinium_carterae.1
MLSQLKTAVAVRCCPGCGGSCNTQMVLLDMTCSSRRVLKTGFGIVKFVVLRRWPLWLGAEDRGERSSASSVAASRKTPITSTPQEPARLGMARDNEYNC